MTIDEAIKILRDTDSTYHHRHWEDYIDAVALGIEALKRVQKERSRCLKYIVNPLPLLPGEAKK